MQFIYKIVFPNNKVYVGRTKDLKARWNRHVKESKADGRKNVLYSAMSKYGVDNLKFEIIEETNDINVYDREIFWIKHYKSTNKLYGYNVSPGGKDRWFGKKCDHTEEEWNDIQQRVQKTKKERCVNAGNKNPMSLESIANRNNCSIDEARKLTPMYGKERDEHTKQRASETHRGKNVLKETIDKQKNKKCKYIYTATNKETGVIVENISLAELATNLGFCKTDFYARINKIESIKNTGTKSLRKEEISKWLITKRLRV